MAPSVLLLMTRRPPRSTPFPDWTLFRPHAAPRALGPPARAVAHGRARRAPAAGARRGEPGDQQGGVRREPRSEEHTSELQSQSNLVCRLLLEKKLTPAARADGSDSSTTI